MLYNQPEIDRQVEQTVHPGLNRKYLSLREGYAWMSYYTLINDAYSYIRYNEIYACYDKYLLLAVI